MSRDQVGLAPLALLFLAWHVPLAYRTEAGLDEDWYGVPGITILRTGLPQIPYIPSRDPGSACFKADVILDALPPLSFYLQALIHLLLGAGIGPARMTSVLAGLCAGYIVHDLTHLWFGDRRAALMAVAFYLVARAFYFPATTARPDMVAVTFGLLALDAAVRYRHSPRLSFVIVAGAAAGLSLLSHPFGVVAATQAGLVVLARPVELRVRLCHAFLFALTTLLVFSLWVPLILLHPDIFREQFGSNVLHRAGQGLVSTLLAPWSVFPYQLRQIWGYLEPIQAVVYGLALVGGTLLAGLTPGSRNFVFHLWASWLLLILFEGKHPTTGYYAYPAAMTSVALAILASRVGILLEWASARRSLRFRGTMPWLVFGALFLAFLPGAGLRTVLACCQHWNDPAYNSHTLARTVMRDIPPQAPTAVDGAFVLDFYLADRPVLEATIHRLSYDFRTRPFEYVVFARDGLRRFRPLMTDLILDRTYGNRSDPFAPYAELYRRTQPSAWPKTGTP
jgi:hypothetical protein